MDQNVKKSETSSLKGIRYKKTQCVLISLYYELSNRFFSGNSSSLESTLGPQEDVGDNMGPGITKGNLDPKLRNATLSPTFDFFVIVYKAKNKTMATAKSSMHHPKN